MLELKRVNSISLIDPKHWDSIVPPNEVFNTHRFIEVVEKAKVEQASFWYLLFYDDGVLVAHAVLSAFNISLDLFISDGQFVHLIKQFFPNFFNVRILFCGLPASFGQLNLKIVNQELEEEVCTQLSIEMEKLADRERISLLCSKEFKSHEADRFRFFTDHSFFKAFSIPYMELDVQWSSFEDYLHQLRHHYRRLIKLSLIKLNTEVPVIYKANEVPANYSSPALVIGNASLCPPKQIYKLYLSVIERTPTKLEVLNLAFFEEFYSKFGGTLEILAVQHNRKIVSAAFLLQLKDELTFMLVGREKDKDEFDSYFNMVYGIIQLGISRQIRKINMGQTAYWVKQRVGAKPTAMFIYFKSRKALVNKLLKKLNRTIFPELVLNPVRVTNKIVQGQTKLTSTKTVLI